MISGSINIAMFSSIFIRMMVDTMDETDWNDKTKDANALLCMMGIGIGQVTGSLFFGRITDKLSFRKMIVTNIIVSTISYAVLILYCSFYKFNWYAAFLMTITWGFNDGGNKCFLCSFLGF